MYIVAFPSWSLYLPVFIAKIRLILSQNILGVAEGGIKDIKKCEC